MLMSRHVIREITLGRSCELGPAQYDAHNIMTRVSSGVTDASYGTAALYGVALPLKLSATRSRMQQRFGISIAWHRKQGLTQVLRLWNIAKRRSCTMHHAPCTISVETLEHRQEEVT